MVREVQQMDANLRVAEGRWRPVYYEDGMLAGFQSIPVKEQVTPRLQAVPATITLKELERNAGLHGRSRTLGMPEWKRQQRSARFDADKILDPEDAIERAVEKVRQWPYPASRVDEGQVEPVFGDRAVRVYPKAPRRME